MFPRLSKLKCDRFLTLRESYCLQQKYIVWLISSTMNQHLVHSGVTSLLRCPLRSGRDCCWVWHWMRSLIAPWRRYTPQRTCLRSSNSGSSPLLKRAIRIVSPEQSTFKLWSWTLRGYLVELYTRYFVPLSRLTSVPFPSVFFRHFFSRRYTQRNGNPCFTSSRFQALEAIISKYFFLNMDSLIKSAIICQT